MNPININLNHRGNKYTASVNSDLILKIIEGVSPTVELEETENGVIMTVTDKDKTSEALIPKGDKGDPGTTDYEELLNQPQINGVTLAGNKFANELGLEEATEPISLLDLHNIFYKTING